MKKEKQKTEAISDEESMKKCYAVIDEILKKYTQELEDVGCLYEYEKEIISEDVDAKRIENIDNNRKELSIDEYMQNIIRILNQTKVVRRSSDKPMMTPKSQVAIKKSSSEAHLTNRGMHQEQVGDLSAEIAEFLGANVNLARAGGKHHDDGHTNSGHTGERIASMIGRLLIILVLGSFSVIHLNI